MVFAYSSIQGGAAFVDHTGHYAPTELSRLGRRLVAEVEEFAWNNGCARIEITGGDHRPDAHAFLRGNWLLPRLPKIYKEAASLGHQERALRQALEKDPRKSCRDCDDSTSPPASNQL